MRVVLQPAQAYAAKASKAKMLETLLEGFVGVAGGQVNGELSASQAVTQHGVAPLG